MTTDRPHKRWELLPELELGRVGRWSSLRLRHLASERLLSMAGVTRPSKIHWQCNLAWCNFCGCRLAVAARYSGYHTHPTKPDVKFAHPTEVENKRLEVTLLPLGVQVLRFGAVCVYLQRVVISGLRRSLRDQPCMHGCPIVDVEDFLGRIVDMDVLPSSSVLSNSGESGGLPFVLKPLGCSSEDHPHHLSMIALSRFTGSVSTQEAPHYKHTTFI